MLTLSAFIGIMLAAVLTAELAGRMAPTEPESDAMIMLSSQELERKMEHSAATLIQSWWDQKHSVDMNKKVRAQEKLLEWKEARVKASADGVELEEKVRLLHEMMDAQLAMHNDVKKLLSKSSNHENENDNKADVVRDSASSHSLQGDTQAIWAEVKMRLK